MWLFFILFHSWIEVKVEKNPKISCHIFLLCIFFLYVHKKERGNVKDYDLIFVLIGSSFCFHVFGMVFIFVSFVICFFDPIFFWGTSLRVEIVKKKEKKKKRKEKSRSLWIHFILFLFSFLVLKEEKDIIISDHVFLLCIFWFICTKKRKIQIIMTLF